MAGVLLQAGGDLHQPIGLGAARSEPAGGGGSASLGHRSQGGASQPNRRGPAHQLHRRNQGAAQGEGAGFIE